MNDKNYYNILKEAFEIFKREVKEKLLEQDARMDYLTDWFEDLEDIVRNLRNQG